MGAYLFRNSKLRTAPGAHRLSGVVRFRRWRWSKDCVGGAASLSAYVASEPNPSAAIAPPPGLSARRPYLTTLCRWPKADRTRTATFAASVPTAMPGELPNNSADAGRFPWAPTGGRSAEQAGGRLESLGPRRGTPRLAQTLRNRELATGGRKAESPRFPSN